MNGNKPISCIKSTEYSIHTRRCFITGEYCSQQTNIQKERQRLHEKGDSGEINAFVIMNFSSVSDVVYEARMKPFIKGLTQYLFLDKDRKNIGCVSSGEAKDLEGGSERWKRVSEIHVHRADTNPVSNYIICNRICQQLQIADLIIVDVSVESANVFYELGLATAFHKLILPVCFSDSFYAMKFPQQLEKAISKQGLALSLKKDPTKPGLKKLEHHIDCFPWRRKLFEHFGIRYQGDNDPVRYYPFPTASSENYGFSDTHYNHFPYTETLPGRSKTVGHTIYDWLAVSYNAEAPRLLSRRPSSRHNTVVLYTMGEFLNVEEAGRCIVNFYNNITKPMLDNYCFCGDRVAVLGQPNKIWDDPKDTKTGQEQLYSVSDLIRIGMDQATFLAERKRIKTEDYLSVPRAEPIDERGLSQDGEAVKRRVKEHIRNRSIPLNTDDPVYVLHYKEGIQQGLDDQVRKIREKNASQGSSPRFFCLYHIMLDTLRYTNEVVVDLSSNSIQAMFWLGAAHGSDVYAVTVRHEMSDKEKVWSGNPTVPRDRPIFDVGGLWTATLRYGEIGSFHNQLELIQLGIDQHARLKLPETELESYEYEVFHQLHHAAPYLKYGNEHLAAPGLASDLTPGDLLDRLLQSLQGNERINAIQKQLSGKSRAESLFLESYYRDRFWRQMLRDNQLHLFLPLNDTDTDDGPRLQLIKWDIDTVAELSHYLSKRKVIGKYQFDTLRSDEYYGQGEGDERMDATGENFISIGDKTSPIRYEETAHSLSKWLQKEHQQRTFEMTKWSCRNEKDQLVHYRGFGSDAHGRWGAQFLNHDCIRCPAGTRAACTDGRHGIESFPPLCSSCSAEAQPARKPIELPRTLTLKLDPQTRCYAVAEPEADLPEGVSFRLEAWKDGQLLIKPYPCDQVRFQPGPDACPPASLPQMVILKRTEGTSPLYAVAQSIGEGSLNGVILTHTDSGQLAPTVRTKGPGTDYVLPAQLLLWRQQQPRRSADETRTEYKYHVSLVGVSGPATKALTALLVDDEQKWGIWGSRDPGLLQKDLQEHLSKYLPLNTLQSQIRRKFCTELLEKAGAGDGNRPSAALRLSVAYLSTILPQYFLPFLSASDEKRIYHALEAFLRTVDTKDDRQFEGSIKKDTAKILAQLKCLLATFRGVDALYEVEVFAPAEDDEKERSRLTDNRRIKGIRLLRPEGHEPVVSCLYTAPDAGDVNP